MHASFPLILAQSEDTVAPVAPGGGTPAEFQSVPADGSAVPGTSPQPAPPAFGGMMWIFLIVIVVMWVFMLSGSRKEKKRRAELLASLKKGARVQTSGGILGTIVEVRDDEVIVKVDENTNARLRFTRSSIQHVLSEDKD